LSRLSLAITTFFRLLASGPYAAQIAQLPAHPEPVQPLPKARPTPEPEPPKERDLGAALQLLSNLQREGRLVDFVRQDITGFSDADVGAAARVVHQGCRRAIDQAMTIEPIRDDAEGATITLNQGFDAKSHRLVGNVQGQPPYRGNLRHRGWRVTQVTLEEPLAAADLTIIAPAEVEL
jgi:hypothetical protein